MDEWWGGFIGAFVLIALFSIGLAVGSAMEESKVVTDCSKLGAHVTSKGSVLACKLDIKHE